MTIIIALASKAEFTFLDEPVEGLDVVAREQFYKLHFPFIALCILVPRTVTYFSEPELYPKVGMVVRGLMAISPFGWGILGSVTIVVMLGTVIRLGMKQMVY